MIRYLLILLAVGAVFLGLSHAWPQEKPASQAPGKTPQAKQTGAKEAVNPFLRRNNKNGVKDPKRMEDKVILSQLPGLKLRGILKLKDHEPVGLLEVATRESKEIHPVRMGDEISVTLPGEDIIRTSDLVTPPEPPPGQEGEEKTQNKQASQNKKKGEGQQVGAKARPSPRIRLKEIQVVLKVVEISLDHRQRVR